MNNRIIGYKISDNEPTILFYDGFEVDLSNWYTEVESGGSGGVVQRSDIQSAGTYSMRVTASTYGYYTLASLHGLGLENNIIFEFDIRFSSGYTNPASYIQCFDSIGNRILSLLYSSDNKIYYNGGDFSGIDYDTWVTMKLVINMNSQNFDIYVNDTLKASGVEFENVVTTLSEFRFRVGGGSSNTMRIYVDEFKLYN